MDWINEKLGPVKAAEMIEKAREKPALARVLDEAGNDYFGLWLIFDGDSEVLGKVLLICLAGLMLPALIPKVRSTVSTWLLEHNVLVAADAALLPVPFMGGGLDLRRLVIITLIAIALVWAGHARPGKGAPRA